MRISFDEIIKGSLPRSGFTIIDNILDDDSAFAPNNIDFISGELIKVLVPDLGDILCTCSICMKERRQDRRSHPGQLAQYRQYACRALLGDPSKIL
jgi:hypothetical protein